MPIEILMNKVCLYKIRTYKNIKSKYREYFYKIGVETFSNNTPNPEAIEKEIKDLSYSWKLLKVEMTS